MKKEKDVLKGIRRREILFAIGILIIPLSWWAFTFTFTTTNTIILAFKDYNPMTTETVFCGFKNFEKVLDDMFSSSGVINTALINSLILWFIQVFIAIPLAVVVSFALYKKVYGAGIFKVILFLPQIISGMVWILIYKTVIEYGFHADWIIDENVNFYVLLFYNLWLGFAGNMVMYTGAMSRIPPSLVEAGHLDGMKDMQEFIHIVIPLIFPTLSVILITCIISIFTIQLPVYAFFGQAVSITPEKYHLYTLGFYTFIKGLGEDLTQTPLVSALSMIVCLIAAPVTLGLKTLLNKIGPTVEY